MGKLNSTKLNQEESCQNKENQFEQNQKNSGMQEESLLRVLSENYESLYYVDFDAGTITPYRMGAKIEKLYGDYFRSNPSYEDAMVGYIKSSVSELDQADMLKIANPEFIQEQLRNRRVYTYDYRVERDDLRTYYRFKISKLDEVGEPRHAVVGFAEISDEMERMQLLRESTAMLNALEKDALTGLYSKQFFFKKVEQHLAEHPNESFMLWTSDIQGLKIINEKYGMEVGDEVLRTMATNGSTNFPGYIFGGRIEGDKLSALMVDTHPDFDRINKTVIEGNAIEFPVPNVSIKHGVFHINKGCTLSVQGMYDRSMLALQSIKYKYGQCVAEYDDKLRKDLLVQRQVTEDASRALEEHQFQVYYQPKHEVMENHIGGAEALVRWIHPDLGFMNPGIFIPLFEQNGFITKMDFYIWEEVCKSLREWKEKGLTPIPVSVNVSRRDFEVDDLAQQIIDLVDRYDLDHSLLHVEVTESAYSDNPERIMETVKMLHDSGFVVELDDFGTGYSSMTALSKLDLDIMKLDMSIIQNDVPGSAKNILEFSMQLAKMMKLKTVAEGVETDAQAKRIKELGGDYIQGYLFSKPLPKTEFEEYLRQKQS